MDVLTRWRSNPRLAQSLVDIREFPARPGRYADIPARLHPSLVQGLWDRGVPRLYSHQVEALDAIAAGEDIVVATPTASGKSLCYHLPVFDALLSDPTARALYLFPTKALARDQVASVRELVASCRAPSIGVAVFDGDTPPDHRRRARNARIIATNPDMLHAGILPHHASWAAFFAGLKYVVVDELHTASGLFGAGVANVLRRLRRVAAFHGASPRFIATSATIGNPAESAGRVLGSERVRVIDDSGAPQGPRTFAIYNPPVIDSALGLRASYLKSAERLARDLVEAGLATLVFARSRRAVEIIVRYLREDVQEIGASRRGLPDAGAAHPRARPAEEDDIRSYRGGYLPDRRREVETQLRDGSARCVVATSALELGIDVGGLDAVVIAGWPGSRAAAWQRAGRAGRRGTPSLVVMVACSEPLDQYVANDPEYLFGASPEHGRVDPDNLAVLVPHIKCAAFELPFADGEGFGPLDAEATREVLRHLARQHLVHEDTVRGTFHWIADSYPAQGVPLRGVADENFAVVDVQGGAVLAEVDHHDAARQLHENAIYPLEGQLYQVERLDWNAHKAFVRLVDVDYTTDALTHTRVHVLETLEDAAPAGWGDVHVVDRVVGFKKIKLRTHENVGYGDVALPPNEMHTRALWLDVPPELPADGIVRAAYTLEHIASLLVLCNGADLARAVNDRRIYLYDNTAGGAGLSERLFHARADLIERAARLIRVCVCTRGCPGCVGALAPAEAPSPTTPKVAALAVLRALGAPAA